MKKVLFVTTVGGFVSQFEMNDVRILQDKGCEIHYAANFDNNVYYVEEDFYKRHGIIQHNVPMVKSPLSILKNYKVYKEVRNIIDREKIDLVHCHTPVGGVIARMAANRSKKKPKVIYTAHGFHFYKGGPISNWCIYYPIERFMAKCTDGLITINNEDYERAKNFKLREGGNVYKIPGVGLDEFFMNDENSYKCRDKELMKLVSISELNKNKNHKVAIKAVKKLIDAGIEVFYDIYGKGPYEKKLEKYIIKKNLNDYVKLRGYTSEPREILKEADCFLFPSIREGLGMSALEAMASGVPVISSENRGTKEYMIDGYNGIVCRQNKPREYVEAILKLQSSSDMRMMMGSNAKETAKRFSRAHSEAVMRKVYESFFIADKR